MNKQTVDALSHRAARAMSRRGSLLTLGGALAATIGAPSRAQAKNSKKSRKAKKRKAQQRAAEQAENHANQVCQGQVAGCRAHILDVCESSEERCIGMAECCSALGACDVNGFFACLVTVVTAGG